MSAPAATVAPAVRAHDDAADELVGWLIERVDRVLAEFVDARAAYLSTVGPELGTVTVPIRRFVLDGGKRLRPRFAYWGWRSVKGARADDSGLLRAAASLELLHACALVQDDVMDDSATRRGKRATHAEFAALHRDCRWPGDARVFGAAAAILSSDLLLTWADTMFAAAQLPAANRSPARQAYDRMRELVIAGQYLDVLAQTRGDFSVEAALRVARFKTATYTVEGPLRVGAAAAGAPAEVIAALSTYGTAIGEAFQLRDDVLGVFGDPLCTGKPAGDDLREGKQTLLVALAYQAASARERELLRCELGNRRMSEARVAALREIMVRTGALDRVERWINQRTAQALAALQTDAISEQARAALASLAIASTDRHT